MAATPHPEQDVRKFMQMGEGSSVADSMTSKEKRKEPEEDSVAPKKRSRDKRRKISKDDDDLPSGMEEIIANRLMAKTLGDEGSDKEEEDDEDPAKIRRLITDIQVMYLVFPEELSEFASHHEPEKIKTVSEGERILEQARQVIKNGNGKGIVDLVNQLPVTLLEGYEWALTNFTPIRAQGISNLAYEPHFSKAAKEVILRYMPSGFAAVPAEWVLGGMLLLTTVRLHEENLKKEGSAEGKTDIKLATAEPQFNEEGVKKPSQGEANVIE